MHESGSQSQPSRACFSVTQYKTECTKRQKQAAAEGGCSNLKGGNTEFGDFNGL